MLIEPPSEARLRDTFERVLTGVLDGSLLAVPLCNGLDERRPAPSRLANAARSRNVPRHRQVAGFPPLRAGTAQRPKCVGVAAFIPAAETARKGWRTDRLRPVLIRRPVDG